MARTPRQVDARSDRLFYSVFLPIGVILNLSLGLIVLSGLMPQGFVRWAQLGTGAFCCAVAGWLAATAWSKAYWSRSMARQVAHWGRIADTFFTWLEEAPLPAESLRTLKSSLEEVVPSSKP